MVIVLLASTMGWDLKYLCAKVAGLWHSAGVSVLCFPSVLRSSGQRWFLRNKSGFSHMAFSMCPDEGREDVKCISISCCIICTSRCWQKAFVGPWGKLQLFKLLWRGDNHCPGDTGQPELKLEVFETQARGLARAEPKTRQWLVNFARKM